MDSQLRAQVVFHLTGRRGNDEAQPATLAGLRPALMSAYRDLDSLRYDFPVILAQGDGDFAQSLSGAVDAAISGRLLPTALSHLARGQIGRASCRERV